MIEKNPNYITKYIKENTNFITSIFGFIPNSAIKKILENIDENENIKEIGYFSQVYLINNRFQKILKSVFIVLLNNRLIIYNNEKLFSYKYKDIEFSITKEKYKDNINMIYFKTKNGTYKVINLSNEFNSFANNVSSIIKKSNESFKRGRNIKLDNKINEYVESVFNTAKEEGTFNNIKLTTNCQSYEDIVRIIFKYNYNDFLNEIHVSEDELKVLFPNLDENKIKNKIKNMVNEKLLQKVKTLPSIDLFNQKEELENEAKNIFEQYKDDRRTAIETLAQSKNISKTFARKLLNDYFDEYELQKSKELENQKRKYAESILIENEGNTFKSIKDFMKTFVVDEDEAEKYIKDAYRKYDIAGKVAIETSLKQIAIGETNNEIKDTSTFLQKAMEYNGPKCPHCGSGAIEHIDALSRGISVGLFGLASSSIGKTMRCKKCGYKW